MKRLLFTSAIGSILFAQEALGQSCVSDTRSIYNGDHLTLWGDFIDSTFEKCSAGMDSDLCAAEDLKSFRGQDNFSHFHDLRALRGTKVYKALYDACLAEKGGGAFIPVEVDTELFYTTGIRYLIINQLECLPVACTNSYNDLLEAFFVTRGSGIRDWAKNGMVEFHPLVAPGTGGGGIKCDPNAGRSENIGGVLQAAYNDYVAKYHKDWEENRYYCSTWYASSGEFDSMTVNFHNNFNSEQYKKFEQDCLKSSGEICTVDIIITKQETNGDVELLGPAAERFDYNWIYRGLPQCFHKDCDYEDKVKLAESILLKFFFDHHTEDRRQRHLRYQSAQPQENMKVTTNFPFEMSHDSKARGDNSDQGPQARIFDIYEGSKKCGDGFSSCHARLSNVCLRSVKSGTVEAEEDEDIGVDLGSGFDPFS